MSILLNVPIGPIVASKSNDPVAVPATPLVPAIGVKATFVSVQRIESAEAILGTDNKTSRSNAATRLRRISRFIIPPSLVRRLTGT